MQTTTLLGWRVVGAVSALAADPLRWAVVSQLATMLWGDRVAEADLLGSVSHSVDVSDGVTGKPSTIMTGGPNFRVADHPPRIVGLTATASRGYNFAHGWALPLARSSDLMKSNHR
jgi:hypothetical protein